ncbi:MAG: HAMP domain-containing protein [Brevinematales bacterium]|nr:HAMP domain-containing protein [Brevinematales bacterium]
MASLSNKIFYLIIILVIGSISIFLGLQTYSWLLSIGANETLRTVIPSVVFISSSLGLWVTSNFLKIFIFQQRGIKGYQLRGKISLYFLLVSMGSILLVGGMMYYLILLLEDSFIRSEREISQSLMKNYNELVELEKLNFERETLIRVLEKPGQFPVIFKITNNEIKFVREESGVLSGEILQSEGKIVGYYSSIVRARVTQMFYLGENYNVAVFHYQKKALFFVQHVPLYLYRPFAILNESMDSFSKLNTLKQYIQPITILSIIVFSVPILIAVFFISMSFGRRITSNIEDIATGTRIIADGNLNYRVKISSRDEIGDLAVNFNRMAQKLKIAAEQIKRMERLEAWQEMAKRLAHEVKNPLTPIKLSAERLMVTYGVKTPQEFAKILDKTVSTVINETQRLETLVNEFSKFARLPYLSITKSDIIAVLHEIGEFFRGAYPDFKLECECHRPEFIVEFDVNQFKQVIINIITNAIEACADREKQVKMTTSEADDRIQIAIRDKSGGISPAVQEKMFEPYYTTKASGTGLGLAIAERIILEHGGNIWFETDAEGTVFYLELPVRHDSGTLKGGMNIEEQNTGG